MKACEHPELRVRLDPAVMAWLKALASDQNRSLSGQVAQLLQAARKAEAGHDVA